MRTLFRFVLLCLLLLSCVLLHAGTGVPVKKTPDGFPGYSFFHWGTDVPVIKALDGSVGQLRKDSVVMVEDGKFFNAAYDGILLKPYPVKSMISLEINEGIAVRLQTPFTATARFQITLTGVNNTITTIDTSLTVNYDTAGRYSHKRTLVFDGAYRVSVKVMSLDSNVTWPVWRTLKLVSQLQSFPQYVFDCSTNAVKTINKDAAVPAATGLDALPVWWAPATGADEYDLEWTYIDESALNRYGTPPDADLLFDNNSSRVTITGSAYNIPLFYDNKGHLFFRVRSVQVNNGIRYEANWSSAYSGGLGRFDYNGHETPLNWQATTTFAEEGKRKTVVQYYDGSLRARQTVTKDNTTNRAIVAESLYDYQGRPVIQVLPAPTLKTVIQYNRNFNVTTTGTPYDKSLYDTLADPSTYCMLQGLPMGADSGASRYYSPNNDSVNSGFNKYIPDAKGYPFTEVEYTQDNTGRISRQSGVGDQYKIGSGHETKYFYSTPDQRELDALFGTEVGYNEHYFKNAVRDANGQYSISYTDMRGRTIATALAGNLPDSIKLDKLASNNPAWRTETLSDPTATVIRDWTMENKKGLLVTTAGDHQFTYQLDPRSLQLEGCDAASLCYDCLYDLEITITDDCNNQKLGGAPFDTVLRNFSINAIDTTCASESGFSFSFSKWLPEGSYEVTKRLSISRQGMDYYRDSVFLKNNQCRSLENFIEEQRALLSGMLPCGATCQGCTDSLGSWETFWSRFRTRAGIQDADTALYRTAAMTAYQEAQQSCSRLCNDVSEAGDMWNAMLADMMPSSGQYANLERTEDRYSIFYAPDDQRYRPFYQTVTDYKDMEGKLDTVYDEVTNRYVLPYQLSRERFAEKFKTSWARSLLPHHPEFCKLDKYVGVLGASHVWDRRFEAVDTYAEAKKKGYLNPTGNTTAPFTYFNGTAGQLDPDPFKNHVAGAYLTSLEERMRKVFDEQGVVITMWGMSAITATCHEPDNNTEECYNRFASGPALDTAASLCTADRDMAWRAFRQMYLNAKREVINQWLKDQCPSTPSALQLTQEGHQPHFAGATEMSAANNLPLPATQAAAGAYKQENEQKLKDYYRSNCEAYVTHWWQSLKGCVYYDNATFEDSIKPALLKVCEEGSDLSHPYGSSSVKPTSSYPYKSFEEVLRAYNQRHGITANNCNAYGITTPKPYDQQTANGNKPLLTKPDSCECSRITALQDKYQESRGVYTSFSDFMKKVYQVNMTDSVLNLMVGLCAGTTTCNYLEAALVLPPAMQCNTGDVCIDCDRFRLLDDEFRALYPGVAPVSDMGITDSVRLSWNRLYEQFMNYRSGFAKTAREYLAFSTGCGGRNSNLSCDSLHRIVVAYKNNRQQAHGVKTALVTDPEYRFSNFRDIVKEGYIRLPDSLYNGSSSWYTNVEVTQTNGKFCWSNGFAVEARLRFTHNLRQGEHLYLALFSNVTAVFYRVATFIPNGGDTIRAGIYLSKIQTPTQILFQGFEKVFESPESIKDWFTIRTQATTTNFYVYVNGRLIKDVARPTPGPLTDSHTLTLGMMGRGGNVDYIRMYNGSGQLKYNEDYKNVDNPAYVANDYRCPTAIPDCRTAFVQYFNQQSGTGYTFKQIDSIYYRTCGLSIDVCSEVDTLQQLAQGFNIGVSPYRINVANTTPGSLSFTDANAIIRNGMMRWPDSVREDDTKGWVYHKFGRASQFFCLSQGYSIELQLRSLLNVLDFGNDVFYLSDVNGGFVLRKYASGLYMTRITGKDGVELYEGNLLLSSNPHAFSDGWNKVKFVMHKDLIQFWWNDRLIKAITRAPVSLSNHRDFTFAFFDFQGAIDWVRLNDQHDEAQVFEEFTDPAVRSIVNPGFICPAPATDCEDAFVSYFNQRRGTSYNWSKIDSIYKAATGKPLEICGAFTASPTLCGRAEPVFPAIAMEKIDNCSDSSFYILSKAQKLYEIYQDSLKGKFNTAYINKCLSAYQFEKFTVRHAVSEYHYTLYYYDQGGNLVKTIPPAGVRPNYDSLWLDSVAVAREAGTEKTPLHELPTQYRYNTLNQVVAQKSPDGGQTAFWYDRLGRLAISQNQKQRDNAGTEQGRLYSYTRYDALGRIGEVGQLANIAASGAMTDQISRSDTRLNNWINAVLANLSWVTITRYDLPYAGFTGVPDSRNLVVQRNLRNRVSYVTTTRGRTSTAYNSGTFYSYDIHGNVDTLLQDYGCSNCSSESVGNIMNRNGNRFKKIAYNYDLISGKVNMVQYQRGFADQFFHRYSYDAENRLILAETSLDSLVWEQDARYEYYAHGPLARVLLGSQKVQGIDYAYTLQGWLKGVNSTGAMATHDIGSDGKAGGFNQYVARDAYGFNLNYYAGDYTAINSTVSPFPHYRAYLNTAYKPLYNGNISSIASTIRGFEAGSNWPDSASLFYNYTYDQLNRLTGMDVFNKFNRAGNEFSQLTPINSFKERVAYDPNGNILKYLRHAGGASPEMDSLTYYYYANTNRLQRVRDTVRASKFGAPLFDIDNQDSTNNYLYDAIGNIVIDRKEQISRILWSVYGKITDIDRASTASVPASKIQYTYDPQGNRISKVVTTTGGMRDYTWYVRDAQGNVLATYNARGTDTELQNLVLKQGERYIYGSNRLGVHTVGLDVDNGSTGPVYLSSYGGDTFYRGDRQYELSNHLGNVLSTVSDWKKGIKNVTDSSLIAYYEPVIVSAQEYYPFGMMMRQWNSAKYRYLFNGKESDNEVKGLGNQIDYDKRIYDPRLGKFLSVDPLTQEYPWYTPYQFAGNSPITNVDIDGAEEEWYKLEIDKTTGGPKLTVLKVEQKRSILGGLITWKGPVTRHVEYNNSNYTFTEEEIGNPNFGNFYKFVSDPENWRATSWYTSDEEQFQDFATTAGGVVAFGAMGAYQSFGKSKSVTTPKNQQVEVPATTTNNPTANQQQVATNVQRPTAAQSEQQLTPSNIPQQVAFKNGKVVSVNKKGSVRPEAYDFNNKNSFEVKNYSVGTEKGIANLVRNVVKQVRQRLSNLPKGSKQNITIDVRGQNIKQGTLNKIKDRISTQAGSQNVNIQFRTDD